MSIEIPLPQRLTVEQAIAAANAAKISAQQALANIPAAIDAEVGPASEPYILQSESARDAAVAAKTTAEGARDNALATERRIRQQSLGQFANDAAAEAWAAAQSPAITIITGSSYLNTTSDIFRYAVVSTGPTVTWHDVTEDEAAQVALATASAVAAAASLSDFVSRYLGPFNSTPTYVGGSPPWNVGALYWNRLQTKFFVWNGASWDATDVSAQAAKAAAQDAAATSINIAAGLSASTYTLDGIDAQRAGAIISPAKGLVMLNGAIVPCSDLLSISSGAKYVVGPDGNYKLIAANTAAIDWSSGRPRWLIEANGSTNYSLNSEATPTFWTPERSTVETIANGLYGTLALQKLTAKSPVIADNGALGRYDMSAGNATVTCTFALMASRASTAGGAPYFGIYNDQLADFGNSANVSASVISGPGGVSVQSTGLVYFTNLSLTVPTLIKITRSITSGPAASIYPILYTNYQAVGDVVKYGRPQTELGYGSSYIVSGASPTARAADVVTATAALLALFTAANATIVFRGKILTGDGALFLSNRFYGSRIFNNGVDISLDGATSIIAFTPGNVALPTFGAAMSLGGGVRKAALTGGVVVSGVEPWLSSADTSIRFGDYAGGSYGTNLLVDEIVVWPVFASDAGLQAQARVY